MTMRTSVSLSVVPPVVSRVALRRATTSVSTSVVSDMKELGIVVKTVWVDWNPENTDDPTGKRALAAAGPVGPWIPVAPWGPVKP
jgi:hypothetical protein